MNNKDALENIRRKAPAARKPNQNPEDVTVPTQQMDLMNSQLAATQQQLQLLEERYTELSIHHSMLVQEVIGLQKTVVNHEHVMQNVMSFLHAVDAQRRRDSRLVTPFPQGGGTQDGATVDVSNQQMPPSEDDVPASPLQHASKLLSETNADVMLNPRNLEHINEASLRLNGTLNTPPPDMSNIRNSGRPDSRSAPNSATSINSTRVNELDNLVYPVGQNIGIDPAYEAHFNNIPYPMPLKPPDPNDPRFRTEARKKSATFDPGWIRQPQVLLVEDDSTCRRIGGKFLYAFNCSIDSALDGLEAVNKMHGSKYDLVLMDIIMPNLDGVSACHIIRQFDSTPIIAMTSNIRSDDIAMYFQHGKTPWRNRPKNNLLITVRHERRAPETLHKRRPAAHVRKAPRTPQEAHHGQREHHDHTIGPAHAAKLHPPNHERRRITHQLSKPSSWRVARGLRKHGRVPKSHNARQPLGPVRHAATDSYNRLRCERDANTATATAATTTAATAAATTTTTTTTTATAAAPAADQRYFWRRGSAWCGPGKEAADVYTAGDTGAGDESNATAAVTLTHDGEDEDLNSSV